jgi:3-oxoadipate enol-lactonase
MAAQVAPALTRWFTPEALAVDGWAVRYARERVLRAHPADWAASWRALAGLGARGAPAGPGPPALVLEAGLGGPAPPEAMTPLERPEAVAAALDRFLPRARAGRGTAR